MTNKKTKEEETPSVDLMICTPGHSMMASYVKSLIGWSQYAAEHKISWGFSTGYSSHVADAREIVLSGTYANALGENRPFNGTLNYKKLMWIDSDIEFLPQDIAKLYNSDKDIVCGGYLLGNGDVVVYETYEKGAYKIEEVEEMRDLVEVQGAGFGFICVKQGVFESLTRPWFQSAEMSVTGENGKEYTFNMIGEDMSWCHRVAQNGYKIYFDPAVKVNHHKTFKLTWKGLQPNA
jgi:hypothetical protein